MYSVREKSDMADGYYDTKVADSQRLFIFLSLLYYYIDRSTLNALHSTDAKPWNVETSVKK